MEQDNTQRQIDYADVASRFFKTLRRLFVLPLVFVILGAAVFLARAWYRYVPRYESSAVFSVVSGTNQDDILSYSYYYNNAAASQLADTFPYILETDMMREMLKQELGKSYINGTVTPSAVADTNMFILTVRSSSAQDAYDVLQAVIAVYPRVASYMTDGARIIIREAPQVPKAPYNSLGWKGALAKGAALGLLLALVIVFVISQIRRTVNSADELKKWINLPILATFPQVQQKKRRKGTGGADISTGEGFVETMRGLRVKVLKQLADDQKVIMITGTLAGEGKTTISVGFARSLANDGKKVLLIDADLRKQGTRDVLQPETNTPGLMEFMESKEVSVNDCISPVVGESFFLLSGSELPQKRYSIKVRRIAYLLEMLRSQYDYIILDSPPCGEVADTGLLGQLADAVLYVVKQDYAPRGRIIDGVQSLYGMGGKILGCLFNGVSGSHSRYGYGYGYGKYGYGHYGYGKYGYGKYGYGKRRGTEKKS